MDVEVKMPDIGLDEVEVVEILVKLNEKVEIEQGLITVEGEKSSMEIPSPRSGIVNAINVKIGDKVSTNSIIMILTIDNINSNNKNKEIVNVPELNKSVINSTNNKVHATPSVRRLARDLNIDLNNITVGSGRKNRILKEDVEVYTNSCSNNFQQLEVEKIKINDLQKVIGNNLCNNWVTIPHVSQFDEVDITTLEKFRLNYNNESYKENKNHQNITILIFVIKAIANALLKFPIFNSSLSKDKKTIILKKYINIGVAVDVNHNLFVPVLKNVNKKNITNLSSELIFLSEKARGNKLSKLDVKDGCFTVSNLGGIGGQWFTPIINSPEVAILGVSKAITKPIWNGEKFIASLMLPLSLSYDHRVINGADAARFIVFLKKILSDIRLLLI